MIVRLWRGRAWKQHADAYQTHIASTVFPKLLEIDGYAGGRVLRRETTGSVEFLVLTEWASWDAIRAFAGENPDVAVIDPEARALFIDVDEHVTHFEVAFESRVRGQAAGAAAGATGSSVD
jgi:heme-degrading monooxygenase HmoA